MSLEVNLRGWKLSMNDGSTLAGAHEYTPPAMTIVTTDMKNGYIDAPLPVDDGMEALRCSFKIYGYDAGLLSYFGMRIGQAAPVITARQYFTNGAATGLVEELQGMIVNIAPDARPKDNKAEAAINVEMALKYYRSVYGGVEQFCIDVENCIRRINGVDQLAEMKSALQL